MQASENFIWWHVKNVKFIHDLSSLEGIKTQCYLSKNWHLPLSEPSHLILIMDFINTLLSPSSITCPTLLTPFKKICKLNPHSPGIISLIYASQLSSQTVSKPADALAWEIDRGDSLDITEWSKI